MLGRWKLWLRYLFPRQEREDPAFRDEVRRLSVIGLGVVVLVCFAAPAFMLVTTAIVGVFEAYWSVWHWADLAIVAAGLLGALVFQVHGIHRFARPMGLFVGFVVALTFIVTGATADAFPGVASFLPYNLIVVMLVAIAALPLRPLQTLGLGLSLYAAYGLVLILFPEKTFVPDVTPMFLASLGAVIAICTGLTAAIHHQRAEAFKARQEVVRSQANLALAESSAAQGRLAAVLSHELNSPIAVVRSGLETMERVLKKHGRGELDVDRMVTLLDEMRRPAERSTERLGEIVERMQRFTHLDQAEEGNADLNRLLEDAVSTLGPQLAERTRVTMHLGELPSLRCRPAHMSALFSNLLLNSAAAVGDDGVVEVRSSLKAATIVVEVQDNGRGISQEKLDRIFEPQFSVTRGRVSTTNWGLFNCRSIVTSLGGSIRIESDPGTGTLVRVEIPVASAR